MKKVALAALLVFILAVPVSADVKIRFGILPVLDTLPLQVAVADGLFADQGLDVELISYASAQERDAAMLGGHLEGYFGDIIATYLLIDQNVPMYIALTSWRTTPGFPMFGIVQSPGRKRTLEELKGARIGYSKATIMEYLADRVSADIGVSEDYFTRLEIKSVPIRFQMFLANQIELALLPEPLMTLAKLEGAEVFATAEEMNAPLTVLCLRREFFEGDAEVYIEFLTAYKEAVRRLNATPEAYRKLMAETCRIPKPLIDEFPIYHYPAPALPSVKELDDIQEWMHSKKLIKSSIPAGLILSPIAP